MYIQRESILDNRLAYRDRKKHLSPFLVVLGERKEKKNKLAEQLREKVLSSAIFLNLFLSRLLLQVLSFLSLSVDISLYLWTSAHCLCLYPEEEEDVEREEKLRKRLSASFSSLFLLSRRMESCLSPHIEN